MGLGLPLGSPHFFPKDWMQGGNGSMSRVRVVLTVWLFASLLLCPGCVTPPQQIPASPEPFFFTSTSTVPFQSLTPSDEEAIAWGFLYPPESQSIYVPGFQPLNGIGIESDGQHVQFYDERSQCFYRIDFQRKLEKLFEVSLELSRDRKLLWAPNLKKAVYIASDWPGFALIDFDSQQMTHSPSAAVWAGWWRNDPVFWDQKGPNARLGTLLGNDWSPQWISPLFSYQPLREIVSPSPLWLDHPAWTFQWDRFIFFLARQSGTNLTETWVLDTNTGHYLYVGSYRLIKPICVMGDDVLFWYSWEDQWDPQYRLPTAGLAISHNRGPLQPVLTLQDVADFALWPEPNLLYFGTDKGVFFLRFHDDGAHSLIKLNVPTDARFLDSHLFVWQPWLGGGDLHLDRIAVSPPS